MRSARIVPQPLPVMLAFVFTFLLAVSVSAVGLAQDTTGEQETAGESGTPSDQVLRAGMIGLDTSHVVAFTRAFNDPDATDELAGVKIVAGYPGGTDIPASSNRVERFTNTLRERGVEIVDSIPELLEKVDVVLLESVDGRPHLEQALPVLKARKPMFIDKPLAGSLKDAVAIFEAAKLYDVPVFSSSSLRFHEGPQAVRNGRVGKVLGCDTHGPCSLQPQHPDLFWYGIHGVEALFTCMGTGCQSVTRVHTDDFDLVVGQWEGGRIGSYRGLRDGEIQSGGTAFGEEEIHHFQQRGGYRPMLVEMAKFFHTGKPPVSPEETLELYAFMEAADESKRQGGKPVSIESVLEKARVASAWTGEWDGGGEHCGELRCLAQHVEGNAWKATFTGYCNRRFAYEVTMNGTKQGEQIVFQGEANLGLSDGGLYAWTGTIEGAQFTGEYKSEKGKEGTFTLEKAP